ncbi:MAG: hypothetical protein AAFN43_09755 [Pseudomonadota bacterium]
MKRAAVFSVFAFAMVACTSHDYGPYALTNEDKALQRVAAGKAMCVIDNQARCDHLIENRILFGRFFAPETLGGMPEDEKIRGRRVTTKFVVEALAGINQCNRVGGQSINIIKGMEIDGRRFDVKGTSPLVETQSACFIEPATENS